MRSLTRCTAAAAIAVTSLGVAAGCSFVSKQVGVTGVMACIERECGDEQGAAHQQCSGECRRRYAQ